MINEDGPTNVICKSLYSYKFILGPPIAAGAGATGSENSSNLCDFVWEQMCFSIHISGTVFTAQKDSIEPKNVERSVFENSKQVQKSYQRCIIKKFLAFLSRDH